MSIWTYLACCPITLILILKQNFSCINICLTNELFKMAGLNYINNWYGRSKAVTTILIIV